MSSKNFTIKKPLLSQGNTPLIIKNIVEKQILNGDLKPGSKINQFALTREYNVSMSTIREALLSLTSDGLVHSIPRRGIFVCNFDENDIKAIFAIRRKLEELVASLVIENITDNDVKILDKYLIKMENLIINKKTKKYWMVDIEFHDYIYSIASNKYLTQFIGSLEKKIHFIRMKVLQNPERISSSYSYHANIINLFKEKNYRKSKSLINKNLNRVEQLFLNNNDSSTKK